jgi:hypothetical protein
MLNLTLLPDVKSALTAGFRVADLIRIDFLHPFSLKVKEEDLIDYDMVDMLRERLEESTGHQKITFNNPEIVFLFTLLDLLCKSYFTTFADILEREFLASTGNKSEAFIDERDRLLGTCSRLLAKFREIAQARPGFQELEQKLVLVEETMT